MRTGSVILVLLALIGAGTVPARAETDGVAAHAGQPQMAVVDARSDQSVHVVPVAWGSTSIKEMSMEQLLLVGAGAAAGALAIQTFLAGMGGQVATVGGVILGALIGDRVYQDHFASPSLF